MEDDRYALLGRMTTGVAHDLNNYLTVVDVALALLQRPADGAQREEIDRARQAIGASIRLVRTLLEYARGGSRDPGEVDLAVVVRRTLDVVGRLMAHDIVVIVDVDADTPPVAGIAAELEQLVLNLVLNARDAMAGGGTLRLSVSAPSPTTVALTVADTGDGITPEAARATGPTTASTRPGRNGRGLGLGIVRAAVERHGADLRLARGAEGGTVATVTFRRA